MLEVFKYIPEEEFYKIEPDFIETIYQEHDMYYDFKFDETKQLDKPNLLNFLKKQETNGHYFTRAMNAEAVSNPNPERWEQ